jgi:large subunit ribosomal protein L29
MKAKDLRERTTEHLKELEKQLTGEVFQARFKNFTNRLNDTATIRKTRRDLARIKTILTQRLIEVGQAGRAASSSEGGEKA